MHGILVESIQNDVSYTNADFYAIFMKYILQIFKYFAHNATFTINMGECLCVTTQKLHNSSSIRPQETKSLLNTSLFSNKRY